MDPLYLGTSLGFGLGCASLVLGLSGPPPEIFVRYAENLERKLRFLRLAIPPRRIALFQWLAAPLGVLVILLGSITLGGVLLLLVAIVPSYLGILRTQRVTRLENQIEGWLGALGRGLEAAPSLGEALRVSAEMADTPLRDELEETLNEVNLGRPLDQALEQMGERVGSRTFTLALATLQVGRETGGQLPDVLRRAAASLREMARLEGVLRTKTADGRTQAVGISLVPFALYLGMRFLDPTFYIPLESTPTGHLVFALVGVLWVAAILWSYKIMSVQM